MRTVLTFHFQWGAAIFEFGTTYLLIRQDGKVLKDDLRGVYDVSPSEIHGLRVTPVPGTLPALEATGISSY